MQEDEQGKRNVLRDLDITLRDARNTLRGMSKTVTNDLDKVKQAPTTGNRDASGAPAAERRHGANPMEGDHRHQGDDGRYGDHDARDNSGRQGEQGTGRAERRGKRAAAAGSRSRQEGDEFRPRAVASRAATPPRAAWPSRSSVRSGRWGSDATAVSSSGVVAKLGVTLYLPQREVVVPGQASFALLLID